jgi:hypothetical protein
MSSPPHATGDRNRVKARARSAQSPQAYVSGPQQSTTCWQLRIKRASGLFLDQTPSPQPRFDSINDKRAPQRRDQCVGTHTSSSGLTLHSEGPS